jgi:Domain of unknown function (DUF5710)
VADSKVWLDVPYAEKDEAKAQGARWDAAARRWYAPRAGITALERWQAVPDVPDLLPGEDRSFGSGLFVDLVPSSSWFTNVRLCVSMRDWERLRRTITTRADSAARYAGAARTVRLAAGWRRTSAGRTTSRRLSSHYVGLSACAPTGTPPRTSAWRG